MASVNRDDAESLSAFAAAERSETVRSGPPLDRAALLRVMEAVEAWVDRLMSKERATAGPAGIPHLVMTLSVVPTAARAARRSGPVTVACRPACGTGGTSFQLCHRDVECPSGAWCCETGFGVVACAPPGSC